MLAASVNLDTVGAIAPREDTIVTMYSAGYDKPFVVDIADTTIYENEKETTFALIRGVAAKLKEQGFPVARRTVAKYRGVLGIPGTSERRVR